MIVATTHHLEILGWQFLLIAILIIQLSLLNPIHILTPNVKVPVLIVSVATALARQRRWRHTGCNYARFALRRKIQISGLLGHVLLRLYVVTLDFLSQLFHLPILFLVVVILKVILFIGFIRVVIRGLVIWLRRWRSRILFVFGCSKFCSANQLFRRLMLLKSSLCFNVQRGGRISVRVVLDQGVLPLLLLMVHFHLKLVAGNHIWFHRFGHDLDRFCHSRMLC